MSISLAQKDPTDVVDYEIEFAGPGLGDDTIESVTYVAVGVTVGETSHTATTFTLWVSGGISGTAGQVILKVTTVGGRVFERTLVIPIMEL